MSARARARGPSGGGGGGEAGDVRAGDVVEVTLDRLAFGGEAVGRVGGQVVFVAGGAPGDRVRIRVAEVKRGFARGALVEVVAPGEARVAPRCALVPVCGGCQWQEVSERAQRDAKLAIVERALGRLGAEVAPLSTPSPPLGYRTRTRFTVGAAGAIGFHGRRTHEVVDVPACPLLDPRLEAAVVAARAALAGRVAPGGTVAALVGRDGAAHLAVEGARPGALEGARALVGTAGIAGVIVDGTPLGAATIDVAGDGEPPFHTAADGFQQASAAGNAALRRLVAEAVGPAPRRVLELHAGDGNFTRDLVRITATATAAAGAVAQDAAATGDAAPSVDPPAPAGVVAVESSPRAAARLAANAPGARVVSGAAAAACARLVATGERFDVVVLDPPRTGAKELVADLARLTDRVVYVSCDPMTLARDAAALAARGLRPLRATPVDLMPQTFHVEIVCTFARPPAPATTADGA